AGVTDVAGIVTAVRSSSFYMQDPAGDGDIATSDAILVFVGSAPGVAMGDSVLVEGLVAEFFPGGFDSGNLSTTELVSPATTVVSSGNPLPAATVVGNGGRVPPSAVIDDDGNTTFDPAGDGLDFYESLEAMRLQINDAVAVGPTNQFGEIAVVGDSGANAAVRTNRGGIIIQPGDFNPERIILDDAMAAVPVVNTGDTFTEPIIGVLDYSFGNFKLLLAATPGTASAGLTAEATTAAGAGELSVATFNVENLDPGDDPAKFAALAGQIVNNLQAPDILSIQEIQDNNGATNDSVVDAGQTYAELIAAIQAAGGPSYDFRDIPPVDDQDGGQPGGNIRVGFLFRPDRVSFVDRPGATSTTANAAVAGPSGVELAYSPGRIDPTNGAFFDSRKPLAAEFDFLGTTVFVVVNHWNSKGGDDPLFGRAQPPVLHTEAQRLQQAAVVNDFVESILALDPAANVMVIGDLNDFQFSAPLAAVADDDLSNLIDTLPLEERYTYVFDGNSQTLDNFLVSANLLAGPYAFDVVHANAEFNPAARATDHDPTVGRFSLGFCSDTEAPTLSVSVTPNTLWPPNHRLRSVRATVIVSDNTDPNPVLELVSVTSDEPDSGTGRGDLPNDIIIRDDTHFRLRAERAEDGDGRVYTITYQATDACGNVGVGSATVVVPHDMSSEGQVLAPSLSD
ncbi:MAG: endonuclease/exonuclease/phosphatase family protein, partial [Candidatus Promineifilaceae bacterium]